MRSIVYGLVSCLIVLFSSIISADEHGGIHIHTSCGEVVEDDQQSSVCLELKPWYHRQHFEDEESLEEQSERLEDDTAWPGQREEFSDYLMR